jgi:crotonobetainyl-CoA:carnitine CoA-transferase CaiB-like acyl-CoA transferase
MINARNFAGARGPLSGLTFIDCGQFLAAPVVTLYAAAMGARVIKVRDLYYKQC